MEKSQLREMLTLYFNEGELRDICLELDVDYETLPGKGKGNKARELVLYLDRRGRLSEMVEKCQRLRPHVSWASILSNKSSVPASAAAKKILFLAANPLDTVRLRLDREVRKIEKVLRQARFRERFELVQHWAVRVSDLQTCLLLHNPHIVHFSGHGSQSSEIILEDDAGNKRPIPVQALSRLFFLFRNQVQCVVLNACYSENQAQAIAKHIDCVIGMSKAIGDVAAVSFAAAFYQALAFGEDVKTAFDLGCVQIDLEGLEEWNTPKLIALNVDPQEIVFTLGD